MKTIQTSLLLVALLSLHSDMLGQQVAPLPSVNLGDTSFLDAIALPGGVLEEIGQGVHDNRTLDSHGVNSSQPTDVNSGAMLVHAAWISDKKLLGAWYGAEVVLSGAYVDTGGHGIGRGFGDVTLGPLILQWPKYTLFGMPVYQRFVLDLDAPLGQYSSADPVNMSSHAWELNPYYSVTLFPLKRLETSWRVHYLWNGTNSSPPASADASNTQAGQAIHFNATAAYNVGKNVYLGANGYYLTQITDARANGLAIANSKEQIGAIGPGLVVNRGKWYYYANAYREIGAKNTTAGNKLVLRVEKVF